MTAIKLYKWLAESSIEYHWAGECLLAWIDFANLGDFTTLLGPGIFSDGGLPGTLQCNCVCVDLGWICEYFDIDPSEILEKPV